MIILDKVQSRSRHRQRDEYKRKKDDNTYGVYLALSFQGLGHAFYSSLSLFAAVTSCKFEKSIIPKSLVSMQRSGKCLQKINKLQILNLYLVMMLIYTPYYVHAQTFTSTPNRICTNIALPAHAVKSTNNELQCKVACIDDGIQCVGAHYQTASKQCSMYTCAECTQWGPSPDPDDNQLQTERCMLDCVRNDPALIPPLFQTLTVPYDYTIPTPLTLADHTTFFTNLNPTDCEISECQYLATGCGGGAFTAITTPSIIVINVTPWTLSGVQDNPLGYTETICIKCRTKPIGQTCVDNAPFIPIELKIVGLPVDCSAALTTLPLAPAIQSYLTGGTDVVHVTDYENIFTHFDKVIGCPLTVCQMLTPPSPCTVPFVTSNVIFTGPPYTLSQIRTNSEGYDESICFACTVAPATGGTFQVDNIVRLQQTPLDCSAALSSEPSFAYVPTTTPHVIYTTGAANQPVATAYTDIFALNTDPVIQADCPVSSCQLFDPTCISPFSQPDIIFGAADPYQIDAIRTNSVGYDWTFCVKCIVSPINEVDNPGVVGLPDIVFTNIVQVIADPLDCNPSIVDIPYIQTTPITYLTGGPPISEAATYENVFTHTLKIDCPVTNCFLEEPTCNGIPYSSPNIVFGVTPFYEMSGIRTNSVGYTENFCIKCIVSPLGQVDTTGPVVVVGLPDIEYIQDVTVVADPLDCVPALNEIAGGFTYLPLHVIYQTGAANEVITTSYENIYTHILKTDCPVSSCKLYDSATCTTPYSNPNIIFGATYPYQIDAIRTNSVGYDETFCVQCIVSPINEVDTTGPVVVNGLPDIVLQMNLQVIADPLDCSPSIVDIPYIQITPIAYLTGGAPFVEAATYENVFTHTLQADCPVSNCFLEEPTCNGIPYTSPNIVLGVTPFYEMSGIRTNSVGYTENFCIKCIVSPLAEVDSTGPVVVVGLPDIVYTQDVTVVADPLDCLPALNEIAGGFQYLPLHVTYETGATNEVITTSYENIFTHNLKGDCPVSSCKLYDSATCTIPLSSPNIIMAAADPYKIEAIRTNSMGYDETFCVKCIVSPIGEVDGLGVVGLIDIVIQKNIQVIADPLDCSPSLVPKTFPTPLPILYLTGGPDEVVHSSYEALYTHTQKSDCPVSECFLMDLSCTTPSTQTNVKIGPATAYSISGIKTNFRGYTELLCISCNISPLGRIDGVYGGPNLPDLTIVKQFIIEADPLDCTKALTKIDDYQVEHYVHYWPKAQNQLIVPNFNDLFVHVQKSDCPVKKCGVYDLSCVNPLKLNSLGGYNVVIDDNTGEITAIKTNHRGYFEQVCVSCTVSIMGVIDLPIKFQYLNVTGTILDCAGSMNKLGFKNASFPYSSKNDSVYNYTTGYQRYYTHVNKTLCPLKECFLYDVDCKIPLGDFHPLLKMGPAPHFQVFAKQDVYKGYKQEYCVRCDIVMPYPDQPISFLYPDLTATQDPIQCSKTMVTQPKSLTHVKYDLPGQFQNVGAQGYKSLFHVNEILLEECLLEKCELRDRDCYNSSSIVNNTDYEIQGSPDFQIIMSKINPSGYNYSLCVECKLIDEVGGHKFYQKFDIEQDPDCSSAMRARSFPLPDILDYEEDSPDVKIGKNITSFFDLNSTEKCPIDKCTLKDKGCVDVVDQNDVYLDSSLQLYASRTNPDGYMHEFCIQCRSFDYGYVHKTIKIEQNPIGGGRTQKRCRAKITSIDSMGLMTIKFCNFMNTNITHPIFNNTQFQHPKNVNHTKINSTFIDIYVTPEDGVPDGRDLSMIQWNATYFVNDTLKIQLNFTSPLNISRLSIYDRIHFIVINETDIFITEDGHFLQPDSKNLSRSIIKQMKLGHNEQNMLDFGENLKFTIQGALVGNFALNIFLGSSVDQFLSVLNQFQILIHVSIMNIEVPSNAMAYYQIVVPIVTYDLLDKLDQYKDIIEGLTRSGIEQEEELKRGRRLEFSDDVELWQEKQTVITDQTKQLGYDSHNPFLNVGSFSIMFIVYMFAIILLFAIFLPCAKYKHKDQLLFTKLYQVTKHQLLYNCFFKFVFEGYFSVLLAGFLFCQSRGNNLDVNFFNILVIVLVFGLFVGLIPLALVNITKQHKKVLDSKTFRERWFVAYKDVKYRQQNASLYYRVWFVLRRLIFISAGFMLFDYGSMQIMILLYCNLFTLIFHGYNMPLNLPFDNKLALTNEYVICSISQMLIMFSQLIEDEEHRYLFGWVIIILHSLSFIYNTIVVILKALRKVYLILKKYWNRIYVVLERIYFWIIDFMYEHFLERIKPGEHGTKDIKVVKLSQLVGGEIKKKLDNASMVRTQVDVLSLPKKQETSPRLESWNNTQNQSQQSHPFIISAGTTRGPDFILPSFNEKESRKSKKSQKSIALLPHEDEMNKTQGPDFTFQEANESLPQQPEFTFLQSQSLILDQIDEETQQSPSKNKHKKKKSKKTKVESLEQDTEKQLNAIKLTYQEVMDSRRKYDYEAALAREKEEKARIQRQKDATQAREQEEKAKIQKEKALILFELNRYLKNDFLVDKVLEKNKDYNVDTPEFVNVGYGVPKPSMSSDKNYAAGLNYFKPKTSQVMNTLWQNSLQNQEQDTGLYLPGKSLSYKDYEQQMNPRFKKNEKEIVEEEKTPNTFFDAFIMPQELKKSQYSSSQREKSISKLKSSSERKPSSKSQRAKEVDKAIMSPLRMNRLQDKRMISIPEDNTEDDEDKGLYYFNDKQQK